MVELRFARSIYDPPAVHAAVSAYEHLAAIETQETEVEVIARVPAVEGLDELADAFANHVLVETIRRHRAGGGQ